MTGMEGGSNEWQQWEKISGGRESQVERERDTEKRRAAGSWQ